MPDSEEPSPRADGLVAGRFRVLGLLGSGATASVYDTLDTVDGGRVAVKVLHPHLASSAARRDAFLREASRVRDVQHPSLCAVVGSGVFEAAGESQTWTAWQLAPGLTLGEQVRDSGPLLAHAAADLGARVLDGLVELHAAGLVHRDISPSNIVVDVDATGRVRDARIIDFGLVDEAGTTTRGGDVLRSEEGDGVVGNASYASPEQLRGEGVGFAGDLYAVGGVLYFAVVGSPPFARATVEETLAAHLSAPPPAVSVAARDVPVAFDRAIVRALLKDPAARYASADEMRNALREVVARATMSGRRTAPAVAAGPVSSSTRALSPATDPAPRRAEETTARTASPWLWVLAAAATALVVAFVAIMGRAPVTLADVTDPTTAPSISAPQASESASPTPGPTEEVAAPVASASTEVAVPSLVGFDVDAAGEALAARGLQIGTVSQMDGPDRGGWVLASSPAGEALAIPGSRVDLVVASGMQTVPAVSGLIERDAVAQIAAAGFVPVVTRQPHPGVVGAVFEVQPGAGDRRPVGSAVTVSVISELPVPSQEPRPTPTPTPTATPSS